ncbi:MAG TPA: hypothetical protein VFZ59_05395 [Verrucomicrobiae bacterium]|nr:hypothetical protein [Verrucomicrobiae bacterium]
MDAERKTRSQRSDLVLIAFFLIALALPLAGKLVLPDRVLAGSENRRLAKFPKFDWHYKTLEAFPTAFEKYYNDQFGFRNQLIRWHHLTKLRVFGVSPSPKVVLGRDGWMFDRDTVQYYTAPPLSVDALEKWQRFFDERQRFVTAKGHRFLLVLAPLPTTIYPEFLPDAIQREARESRLDQLIAHLRTHSTIPIVDLRESLRAGKSRERLYQRTDTHWNELGAYVGYTQIMSALATDFPELQPLPRSAFEIREKLTPGGDIARLMGLSDLFPEQHFTFTRNGGGLARIAQWYPEGSRIPMGFSMRTGDTNKPRAIVYHDSFTFESLYPFLAENFSEVWFHWNHYFDPELGVKLYSTKQKEEFVWRPAAEPGLAGAEPPVIVILQIAERQLLYDAPPTWEQLEARRLAKAK